MTPSEIHLFASTRPWKNTRHRGVVFIEGLLALSLIFIILLTIRFLHQAHQASFSERARLRFCVWHSAFKGCEETVLACEAGTLSEEPLTGAEQESVESAKTTGSNSVDQRIQSETQGLKRRIVFTSDQKISQPPLLGGQIYEWSTSFSLPCNPKDSQFNISPDGAFRDFK